ncbi:MAG: family 10 glycosylhydrolase [bacterium]|nr:family 10 glycosylhydrolase [bacterium]
MTQFTLHKKCSIFILVGFIGIYLAVSQGQSKTQKIEPNHTKQSSSLVNETGLVRSVWLWGSTVREEGADNIAEKLQRYKFTKVILLVKGGSGQVNFKSKIAPQTDREQDILQEMIDACHKRGIEVHAWFVFHRDSNWAEKHHDQVAYHVGDTTAWEKGPYAMTDGKICPLATEYREYNKRLIKEVLDNYQVDGIHLDYIRYPHIVYCFCPRHQEMAKKLGINLASIRNVIYQTLYERDSTKQARGNLYVEVYKYSNDVAKWVDQRQNEITSLVQAIRDIINTKKPQVKLSAALMPEGGELDDAFALCYYAQNYRHLGKYLDFICPMTYHGSFGKSPEWVVDIATNAERKTGKPVYAGVQAFSEDKPFSIEQFEAVINKIQASNLKGFTIFRYGSMTDEMWKVLE